MRHLCRRHCWCRLLLHCRARCCRWAWRCSRSWPPLLLKPNVRWAAPQRQVSQRTEEEKVSTDRKVRLSELHEVLPQFRLPWHWQPQARRLCARRAQAGQAACGQPARCLSVRGGYQERPLGLRLGCRWAQQEHLRRHHWVLSPRCHHQLPLRSLFRLSRRRPRLWHGWAICSRSRRWRCSPRSVRRHCPVLAAPRDTCGLRATPP